MYEHKWCQMDEGECGFLVGAQCKADPKKPFFIDKRFHDNLKIVGCASWSKYLDYGREYNEGTYEMQKLSVEHTLGGDRNCNVSKGGESEHSKDSPPMHVLQENNNDRGSNPRIGGPTIGNITPCFICQERATSKNGVWYLCDRHGKMYSEGKNLRQMFYEEKELKNNEGENNEIKNR